MKKIAYLTMADCYGLRLLLYSNIKNIGFTDLDIIKRLSSEAKSFANLMIKRRNENERSTVS